MTTKAHLSPNGIPFFVKLLAGAVLFIALALALNALPRISIQPPKSSGSQSLPPTSAPASSQGSQIVNWKIYNNTAGQYSLQYPPEYKVLLNEVVSVDGVTVPAENTLTLVSSTLQDVSTNYVLTINHKPARGLSLAEFVDANSWCINISSDNAKPFVFSGRAAFIFEDTPCGPYGSTVIYAVNDELAYEIRITSKASYQNIKNTIDQILSTFTFTQ